MKNTEQILNSFLNAYWLRPETALWRTVDVEAMKNFRFVSPSLDLGCGDGTFSFLRGGGELEERFDVFEVGNLNKFYANVDVYDTFDENSEVKITKAAEYMIDVGMDHKQNLMNKAARLGLHKKFVQADANKPLPFENESFQTIFSNIIYWLDNPASVFKEIYRILKPGGKCCVMLPNTLYLESSFYYQLSLKAKRKEFDFLQLIDRGRVSDNLKIVNSRQGWQAIIEQAGLVVEDCIPHISKTLIQIWDIGLRPIFPMLKKMVQNLDEKVFLEIKREWVELFMRIGEPIVKNDSLLTQGEEFCFFCFVLTK